MLSVKRLVLIIASLASVAALSACDCGPLGLGRCGGGHGGGFGGGQGGMGGGMGGGGFGGGGMGGGGGGGPS